MLGSADPEHIDSSDRSAEIWQNFGGDKYSCKLGKEYLNASLCKFVVYSLQHSETFDVSHVFLPLTIAELSTLKQVRFLAHPVLLFISLPIDRFSKILSLAHSANNLQVRFFGAPCIYND